MYSARPHPPRSPARPQSGGGILRSGSLLALLLLAGCGGEASVFDGTIPAYPGSVSVKDAGEGFPDMDSEDIRYYMTDDPPAEVVAFYRDRAPDGYDVEVRTEPDQVLYTNRDPAGGGTFLYTVTAKPAPDGRTLYVVMRVGGPEER